MKYNFDEITYRRNTDCCKRDELEENELPMWVADMDFKTAPEITGGLIKRLESGIFGYTFCGDERKEAYINWWKRRHHFEIDKDRIVFSTGVVPTISSTVRKLTKVGDNVVVLTPVYNIFFNSIINNNRTILSSNLIENNGVFSINWEDLEEKLSRENTTLLIFCNPHNPIGKIWSKEDLIKVGELCKRHGVTVISDEIHCDLTEPDKEYVPFASLNDINREISVTCISPTKTFNLAGIQTSAIVIPNKELKEKVVRAINTDEIAEPNILAAVAPIYAFNEGEEWLNELRKYISNNRKIVTDFISKEIPEIKVTKQDATYLLWLDVRAITSDSKALKEFIRKESGLVLTEGEVYGEAGKGFLRMNVATQKERVQDGLTRLKRSVENFKITKF